MQELVIKHISNLLPTLRYSLLNLCYVFEVHLQRTRFGLHHFVFHRARIHPQPSDTLFIAVPTAPPQTRVLEMKGFLNILYGTEIK